MRQHYWLRRLKWETANISTSGSASGQPLKRSASQPRVQKSRIGSRGRTSTPQPYCCASISWPCNVESGRRVRTSLSQFQRPRSRSHSLGNDIHWHNRPVSLQFRPHYPRERPIRKLAKPQAPGSGIFPSHVSSSPIYTVLPSLACNLLVLSAPSIAA